MDNPRVDHEFFVILSKCFSSTSMPISKSIKNLIFVMPAIHYLPSSPSPVIIPDIINQEHIPSYTYFI